MESPKYTHRFKINKFITSPKIKKKKTICTYYILLYAIVPIINTYLYKNISNYKFNI